MDENKFQRSIQRTRRAVTEANRVMSVARRHARDQHELAAAQIELFLDTLKAEGIELTPENVGLFLGRFVEHYQAEQQRQEDEQIFPNLM